MKSLINLLILSLIISSVFTADFSSDKYQKQSKQDKYDQIWKEVSANKTPYGWWSAFFMAELFISDMNVSFDEKGDLMPGSRKKLIHSVGNVGKVKWVAKEDQPYTGLFDGADYGFLRLSIAKQTDTSDPSPSAGVSNFLPGMGLKFMRDGVPSGNIISMFGLNGQNSWNFFANTFSNHISLDVEGLALKLLKKKFLTATPFAGTLGTGDFARFDQNGKEVTNPKIPFSLAFEPPKEIREMNSDFYDKPHTEQIAMVKPGSVIYKILANDDYKGEFKHIGDLVLVDEPMTTSKWGDKELFFRHYFWEDDVQLVPEWKKYKPDVLQLFKMAYNQKSVNPHLRK